MIPKQPKGWIRRALRARSAPPRGASRGSRSSARSARLIHQKDIQAIQDNTNRRVSNAANQARARAPRARLINIITIRLIILGVRVDRIVLSNVASRGVDSTQISQLSSVHVFSTDARAAPGRPLGSVKADICIAETTLGVVLGQFIGPAMPAWPLASRLASGQAGRAYKLA